VLVARTRAARALEAAPESAVQDGVPEAEAA
jgi:hypothetical protein